MVSFIAGAAMPTAASALSNLAPIHNVRPRDELLERTCVHTEAGPPNVGDPGRATRIAWVKELPKRLRSRSSVRLSLPRAKVRFILRCHEGGEMVIEPPGDLGKRRVFEIHNGVLTFRINPTFLKQSSRTMR